MLKVLKWPRSSFSTVYVFATIVLLVASLCVPRDTVFPPEDKIADTAATTLSLIKDMTSLITTLNTTMLAAAAGLVIKGKDWSSEWTPLDSVLIMTVFLLGSLSYFGVYISYIRLLTMAGQATIYPNERGLTWAIRFEYFGTILGVAVLGLVFMRMMEGRLAPTLSSADG